MKPEPEPGEGNGTLSLPELIIAALDSFQPHEAPIVAEAVSQLHISPQPKIITPKNVKSLYDGVTSHVLLTRGKYTLGRSLPVEGGVLEVEPGAELKFKGQSYIRCSRGLVVGGEKGSLPIKVTQKGETLKPYAALIFTGKDSKGDLENWAFGRIETIQYPLSMNITHGAAVLLRSSEMRDTGATGIVCTNGAIEISDTLFSNCPRKVVYGPSGVIHARDSRVNMHNCTIDQNVAKSYILEFSGGEVNIQGGLVSSNYVGGFDPTLFVLFKNVKGGMRALNLRSTPNKYSVIAVEDSEFDITECNIFGNWKGWFALKVIDSTVAISRTRITMGLGDDPEERASHPAVIYLGSPPTVENPDMIDGAVMEWGAWQKMKEELE